MDLIKIIIIIILIVLLIIFNKILFNRNEKFSEGIYNLNSVNEKILNDINEKYNDIYNGILNDEINTKIFDTYNTYNDSCSNNNCLNFNLFNQIKNNNLTLDISTNTINKFPKLNNQRIENYFTNNINKDINTNHMYSPKLENYIYYDLSNNEIKNIISLKDVNNPVDFLSKSPKSIFPNNGTDTSLFSNSYIIEFNKTSYDTFTTVIDRLNSTSGIQINIPDNYNTVWLKVLNSTAHDASFNKIVSFSVKTPDGKFLGFYSNNSIKYIGLQPNGVISSTSYFTWIPIYTGNNKKIILNGDLLLTNPDLNKSINNIYNTNAYNTTTEKNYNCQGTLYNTINNNSCYKAFNFTPTGKTDISGYMNANKTYGFLNGFTGIAFSNNQYNHTKLSGYSLINPNSLKIKNTLKFDLTSLKLPYNYLGTSMKFRDLSNNQIIKRYDMTNNLINTQTNGFAVFINLARSPTFIDPQINKDLALFNVPIIVNNISKIIYFWLDKTIPDNILNLQLYYETNDNKDTLTFIDKKYPVFLLSSNNSNLYPKEYFQINNIYGCILDKDDINNYFTQTNSIKTLDNNFGFMGIALNINKMEYNISLTLGLYEIGFCDYYENISF